MSFADPKKARAYMAAYRKANRERIRRRNRQYMQAVRLEQKPYRVHKLVEGIYTGATWRKVVEKYLGVA